MKTTRLAAALALLIATTGAHAGDAAARYVVPMGLHKQHPVVDVLIGDEGTPLRFVLDTAAGATVIDSAVARRLGLEQADAQAVTVTGAAGEAPRILQTREADWRIGELQTRMAAMHTGLGHLAGQGDGPRIDGILGNDLLRAWDVAFSLPAGRLVLQAPGSLPDGPQCEANALPDRPAPMAGFAFITLRLGDDQVPAIAVVDTGAAQTVLNPSAAEALGLAIDGSDPRVRERGNGTRGLGHGVARTWLYTLPSMQGAGWRHEAIEVRISALPVFTALGLDARPALVLGADALADSELTLSAGAARICLSRVAGA